MNTSKHGQIGHNSGGKMTAAERQKALYERRRAAGWKKSWIDPKTAEVAADLGGIERLGWRYERMAEKIELLERTEQRFIKEFENTANKLFKEKTGEMSQQNKLSLDSLLSPLKTQIGVFSKRFRN